MKKEDIMPILDKYQSTHLTQEEEAKIQRWLLQLGQEGDSGLSEEQIRAASHKIWLRLNESSAHRRVRRLWTLLIAAASVVIAVFSIGLWLVKQPTDNAKVIATNSILPGRDGGTLTLADGTKIGIQDLLTGNIVQQSGVVISKDAKGNLIYEVVGKNDAELKYNTLQTGRGEQTKVRLPDGTEVALNAESSLRYPINFLPGAKRRVHLVGEGYFQVSKDASRPFIVETDGQRVEVLGTHFNINSYRPGQVITTLEEGSVIVFNGAVSQLIKPGQQILNVGKELLVRQADMVEVLGWKEGNFVFNGADIVAVMQQLERWYGVEAVYDGPPVEGLFYANISRSEHIEEILNVLEKTNGVHFKIEGRRVKISR